MPEHQFVQSAISHLLHAMEVLYYNYYFETPLTYFVDATEVGVNLVRNDGVVPDPLRPGGGGPLLPAAPPLPALHHLVPDQSSLSGLFVGENLPSPQL